MRDPKRLLSGEGTDLERSLLRAVSTERPTRDLERRMQAGLGFKGFSAAKALSTVTQLAVVAALGVVASGQASSPFSERAPAIERSAPARVVPPPPRNGMGSNPAANVARETAPAQAASTQSAFVPAVAETKEAPERRSGSASSRRVPYAVSAPGLRDEITLLDRARGALRSGDARRALGELDRYAHKFPRGDFRQEASVLRIEALGQSGQRTRASTLARDFVNQHPKSPHVDRVQRVTGNSGR